MTANDPQDPYKSFQVQASAGSGKTFQLSQRFIKLVAAGSAPEKILTLTFTQKAAAEMRSRILHLATSLLRDQAAQKCFEVQVRSFYQQAQQHLPHLPPPISAEQTARTIVQSAQQLKVATIDSLFFDWINKFPWEAAQGLTLADDHPHQIPAPIRMASTHDMHTIDQQAWQDFCRFLGERRPQYFAHIPNQSLIQLEKRLAELDKQDTFVWSVAALSQDKSAFLYHPLPTTSFATEQQLWQEITGPLSQIAASLTNPEKREQCLAAIRAQDQNALFGLKLLTKDLQISGQLVRGKKRDAVAAAIAKVEQVLQADHDRRALQKLNEQGEYQYLLYQILQLHREQHKQAQGLLEFSDLVKGCYGLFHHECGLGARFLINQGLQHVMFDEFQDTSQLQWLVFQSISTELLAGAGVSMSASSLPGTVFIVGDKKQSIYGFREADPRVLSTVQQTLSTTQMQVAHLNHSFRSSQVLLDFVNCVFERLPIDDFNPHHTASVNNEPAIVNMGRVALLPLADADHNRRLSPVQVEAEQLANYLKRALSGELATPVVDAGQKIHPLQPKDCAILYRAATHAAAYEQALRKAGIPCLRSEESGYFQRPEIKDVLNLLRYLANPADCIALGSICKSPLGNLSDHDFLSLAEKCQQAEMGTTLDFNNRLLANLAQMHPQLYRNLQTLQNLARDHAPHQVLIEALDLFKLWDFSAFGFVSTVEESLAEENIIALLELCLSCEQNGASHLTVLLAHLDSLAAQDEKGNAHTTCNAVRLMTIHKAKGLEFPFVVLADTASNWVKQDPFWCKETTDRTGTIYIGRKSDRPINNSAFDTRLKQQKAELQAEARRLLYVALTRPSQYLVVSGHRKAGPRPATGFYQGLQEALALNPKAYVSAAPEHANLGQHWQSLPESIPWEPGEVVVKPAQAIMGTYSSKAPTQLQFIQPSKHDLDEWAAEPLARPGAQSASLPGGLHRNKALASAFGQFIHLGLQAAVNQETWSPTRAWQLVLHQISGQSPEPIAEEFQKEVYQQAQQELTRLIASQVWQDLMRHSTLQIAELPVVHRRGAKVLNGAIDLYLEEGRKRVRIIDYKTMRLGPKPLQFSLAEAQAQCRKRGYDRQLAGYVAAIQGMRPKVEVTGEVLFTFHQKVVPIIQTSAPKVQGQNRVARSQATPMNS